MFVVCGLDYGRQVKKVSNSFWVVKGKHYTEEHGGNMEFHGEKS